MIIKAISEAKETNTVYQVYELANATSADEKEVSIQKLQETVSVEDCKQRINQMTDEIVRATTERDKYEAILVEIEKL